MKLYILKDIIKLLVIGVFVSCSHSETSKISFAEEVCLPKKIRITHICSQMQTNGADYDSYALYGVAQADEHDLIQFFENHQDSLSTCGYWKLMDEHAIYCYNRDNFNRGHYFEVEYSMKMKLFVIHEIKL